MKKFISYGLTLSVLMSVAITSFALNDVYLSDYNIFVEPQENNESTANDDLEKAINGFCIACKVCSDWGYKYLDAMNQRNFDDAYSYANNAGRAIDLGLAELRLNKVHTPFADQWRKDADIVFCEFCDYGYGSPRADFVTLCKYDRINEKDIEQDCTNIQNLLTGLDRLIEDVQSYQ